MSEKIPAPSAPSGLLIGLLIVVALFIRVAVARDAFWLDEIWSYQLVKLAESPLQVLTLLRIDNNHLLNSWYLYFMGEQPNWFVYRIPAVLTGAITVAVMGLAARELRMNILLVLVLGAIAFPLVQYSAEARGYAPAALCGLSAWYVWFFRLDDPGGHRIRAAWLALFWLICGAGLLAHLSFVFVLLALALTAALRLVRTESGWQKQALRQLLIFSLPFLVLTGLWFSFYGVMSSGGEDAVTRFDRSLLLLGSSLVGSSREPPLAIGACALAAGLAISGVRKLPTEQRYFFVSVMLIVPVILIVLSGTSFFFPRYLLVSMPFFYLAAARALQAGLDNPQRLVSWSAGGILALILGASGWQLAQLLRWGKGDYPQAVNYLYELSGEQNFTVGGDFDFRHQALLDFYSRYRDDADRLTYIENSHTQAQPVDFFLQQDRKELKRQGFDVETGAREYMRLENGAVYQFVAVFPYAGLSGWNWYIYRLTQLPEADSQVSDGTPVAD
jgi:hypothetical protein